MARLVQSPHSQTVEDGRANPLNQLRPIGTAKLKKRSRERECVCVEREGRGNARERVRKRELEPESERERVRERKRAEGKSEIQTAMEKVRQQRRRFCVDIFIIRHELQKKNIILLLFQHSRVTRVLLFVVGQLYRFRRILLK